MTQHPHLAKSAHDAALGMFRSLLEQKAESAAVRVAAVNPWGTSQECSGCGAVLKKDLSVRVHRCSCGLVLNRDVNAARNVLQRTSPNGAGFARSRGTWARTCALGR